MASSNNHFIQPPSPNYDEDVLYGLRKEALKVVSQINNRVDQECVMYLPESISVDKIELWYFDRLQGRDKRLNAMLEGMNFDFALPVQSACWPQMNRTKFPFVCIGARGTGKTFAHILYIVSKSITSVPIAKTDEIIADQSCTSFTTSDKTDSTNKINNLKLAEIDHDNFDFNSLADEIDKVDKQDGDQKESNHASPDDFISFPKYIIVCSSQMSVEIINQEIDKLKSHAFGLKIPISKLKTITPKARIINTHQIEDKLNFACSEADILITTPSALIKCLRLGFVNFSKAKMVIFDDIDLTLKLHNANTRELVKIYLQQTLDRIRIPNECNDIEEETCQMFVFARKWSDLIKHFIGTIFSQRTMIFGSLCEATLFVNLRYELEFCDNDCIKKNKLVDILKLLPNNPKEDDQFAIFCNDTDEAKQLSIYLSDLGIDNQYLYSTITPLNLSVTKAYRHQRQLTEPIYILSDDTIDSITDYIHKVNHLIHYSFPEDFLKFDRRFKLMYTNLKSLKKGLLATIFLKSEDNIKNLKELYDIISRSSVTLNSTKLDLRDFIGDKSQNLCWRYASTGQCRLERLSRDDHFGSYCLDKHSLPRNDNFNSRWPTSGQLKITVTNLISPNEFYFWFDAHRDKNSTGKQWTQFKDSGTVLMGKLQEKLNSFRNTPLRSIKLEEFEKGRVYGIYLPHEERVDRITLLDLPKMDHLNQIKGNPKLLKTHYDLVYDNSLEVWRLDLGKRLEVFIKNIFKIPKSLAMIEAQAHRGFHIGIKPADNEPNWLYKAKKQFHDNISVNCLHSITVWTRFENNNCFWFDNMTVVRKLSNIEGDDSTTTEPHKELCQAGLAETTTIEPPWLAPSVRLETISKWHAEGLNEFVRYAYLEYRKGTNSIFVLHINSRFELYARRSDFNKQLKEVEKKINSDYLQDKLMPLNHFAEGVFCAARIPEGIDPSTKKPRYYINRCKIISIEKAQASEDSPLDMYEVYCLDHGDFFVVPAKNLYLISQKYLIELPFQAIKCSLADLNQDLLSDSDLCLKIRHYIYDVSRDARDDVKSCLCKFNDKAEIYLYVEEVDGSRLFKPLVDLVEKTMNVMLITNNDPDLRLSIDLRGSGDEEEDEIVPQESIFTVLVKEILKEMIDSEFSLANKTAY